MTISIISINYFPQNFGIAKIANNLTHSLAIQGHNINVITARPFDQNFHKINNCSYNEIVHSNIKIIRVPVYLFNKSNFINRVLFDSSFFISSIYKSIRNCRKSDKIVIISPPLQLGLIGILLNLLYKKEFIFYVQDLVPDLPAKLGIIRNITLLKILQKMEKLIYIKSSKIITISNGMAENIKSKLLSLHYSKVYVVNNWADKILEESDLENDGKPFLKSLNLHDKVIALYSGSYGKKQSFESTIPIIKIISENFPFVHFLFTGEGPTKANFIKKLEIANLNNVTFLEFLNDEDYYRVNSESHFIFFPQHKDITNELMPSKIISSIAMGKPIFCLANKNSDVAALINSSKCGIVIDLEEVNNSSIENLKMAFSPLSDKKTRNEYGNNAKKYAEIHFQKDLLLDKLSEIITE